MFNIIVCILRMCLDFMDARGIIKDVGFSANDRQQFEEYECHTDNDEGYTRQLLSIENVIIGRSKHECSFGTATLDIPLVHVFMFYVLCPTSFVFHAMFVCFRSLACHFVCPILHARTHESCRVQQIFA